MHACRHTLLALTNHRRLSVACAGPLKQQVCLCLGVRAALCSPLVLMLQLSRPLSELKTLGQMLTP